MRVGVRAGSAHTTVHIPYVVRAHHKSADSEAAMLYPDMAAANIIYALSALLQHALPALTASRC